MARVSTQVGFFTGFVLSGLLSFYGKWLVLDFMGMMPDSFSSRKCLRDIHLICLRNIPFNLLQIWDKLSAFLSHTQGKYLLPINHPTIQIKWIWIISHDIGSCMSPSSTVHCILSTLCFWFIVQFWNVINLFKGILIFLSFINEKHRLNSWVKIQFLFGISALSSFNKPSICLCNFLWCLCIQMSTDETANIAWLA